MLSPGGGGVPLFADAVRWAEEIMNAIDERWPTKGISAFALLPGRKKEFFYDTSFGREFGDFWELLWSQAAEAVDRSEKIVLCGYSLLPVDQRARELLLRMPKRQPHVTVVCGSQSERIAGDFRAAGLQHVRVFAGGYFEDWVKAAVNESLRP